MDVRIAKEAFKTEEINKYLTDFLSNNKKEFLQNDSLQEDLRVILNYKVKPNLIAGIQIQTNDMLLDKSVYHQLNTWKKRIGQNEVSLEKIIS